MFKKAVGWMLDAANHHCDALVFLTDEDGDRSRLRQMDDAQHWNGTNLPRACGVAIRKFDAWFLADETALEEVLGAHVDRQPEPEKTPDPKAQCSSLLESSELVGSLGELYERVAQYIDVSTLSDRCPHGFAPFATRVQALGPADANR
jgi:hypothetical protein